MMENNYLIESDNIISLNNEINRIIEKNKFNNIEKYCYDLENDNLSKVIESLDTYSLFNDKKIIILENIDNYNFNDDSNYSNLIKYLNNPSKDNLFIITATKLNNTKKSTKEFKKLMTYIKVDTDVYKFVKEKLKDYNLETGVVKDICLFCNNDITKINNECIKIINYKGDNKNIAKEDINLIIDNKSIDITQLTFDFIKYLFEKDKKNALLTFEVLEDNDIEPISMIGLLASQVRIIYQVKVLADKNMNDNEIANTLNEKPYRIKKTRELIHYYTKSELRELIRRLASIDYSIKTSDVDGKFLIELFIINI